MGNYNDKEKEIKYIDINSFDFVSKPRQLKNDNKLFLYYDFITNNYIKCKPYYELSTNVYIFNNMDSNKEDLYFITCIDSYRLINYEDNLELTANKSYYEKEYEWRIKIKINDECDFYKVNQKTNKGEYVKAILFKPYMTNYTSFSICCFINSNNMLSSSKHFESKSIQPSGKYTKPITKSELEELRGTKKQLKIKNCITELENKLQYMCPTKYLNLAYTGACLCGKVGFFDLRPYYAEIIKNSNTVNFKTLVDNNYFCFNNYRLERYNKYDYEWNVDIKDETGFDCIKEFDKNYTLEHNVVFIEIDKTPIEKNAFELFSAFANIKIYGATYAKLKLIESGQDNKIREIDFDYINNEEEPYFTLINITNENPLFCLYRFQIITDGQMYSATGIRLNDFNHKIFGLMSSYHISWLKDYVIMIGKLWQPSLILKIEDITNLDYNPPPKDESNNDYYVKTVTYEY